MKIVLLLVLSAISALLPLSADDRFVPDSPNVYPPIFSSYSGYFENQGELSTVITAFKLIESSAIVGQYAFDDGSDLSLGILSNCDRQSDYLLLC